MNTIEQGVKTYYGEPQTAARGLSPAMRDRLVAARSRATCAGCGQPIHASVDARIVGISTFHPSCGARAAQSTRTIRTPTGIIGTLTGCAAPLGSPCLVTRFDHARHAWDQSEILGLDAFDASIAAGGQQLKLNHTRTVDGAYRRIHVDAGRLMFAFDVHDTPAGREAVRLVRSGAAHGCSVGFDNHRERCDGYPAIARITRARLTEISIIAGDARPALFGTFVRVQAA